MDYFKYLGVIINNRNERSRKTEHGIRAGNRAHYKYKIITRSKEISRKTTMRVCRVALQPVVTYGVETMILRLRWCGLIKRMREEKVVKEVTEWKPDFRGPRGRPKSRWEEHKRAKNPQLEEENPGSEIMKENHKRGTKENVK